MWPLFAIAKPRALLKDVMLYKAQILQLNSDIEEMRETAFRTNYGNILQMEMCNRTVMQL